MSRDGGTGGHDARTTRRAFLAAGAALAAGGAVAGNGTAGTGAGESRTRRTRQAGGDWPSFKNGPANTGHAEGRAAPVADVSPAWTFDARSPVRTAPAVVDGTVYVGADNGRLYAVDAASGEFRWRYGTTSPVTAGPAVGDGAVVFGVRENAIHALGTDGTRRWVFGFGDSDRPTIPPAIRDGAAYCGTTESGFAGLHVIELASGELRWENTDLTMGGSPAPVGGSVHVGTANAGGGTALALDATDGSEQWSEFLGGEAAAPAVVDGTAYVATGSEVLVADAGADGGPQYTVRTGSRATLATSATVAADTLFLADTDGVVLALDAADGLLRWNERVQWTFDTGSEVRRAPVIAGDTLFVGCEDGSVYAVDASTGEGRWRFETGGAVRGPPAVVDGTVFVGSADGTVYALTGETRTETLSTVEGTPTPTASPTRTATPTGSPTPTRSPTPEPTATPSPTATAEPTPPTTTTRTSTREPTRSRTTEPAATAVSGRNAILGDVPTDLLLGVGGVAALGGAGLAARRVLGGGEPGDGSGTGGAPVPKDSAGETPGVEAAADGSESDDPFAAAAERAGSTTGTAAAADADAGDPEEDPETLDIETVRESTGLAAGGAVAYDDIERVGERPTADGTVAHEALLPTPTGERRVLLRQPAGGETLDAAVMARFADAAETWAALGDHENVVEVVEWGTEPLPWLALAHLDRELTSVAGALSPTTAATVAAGIAEGVHHGHTRGVTHRALRPGAVRLDGDTDPPRPAVGDWGLADAGETDTSRAVSLAPAYAAPEQFEGVEAVDVSARRTDVYGLGAVCYELFTGQPPFEGDRASVLAAKRSGTAPRPTAVDDSLPDAVDTVLGRAIAVDPTDRYEDVLYLRDALRDLAR